jgi:hypothetical protein
MQDNKFPLPCEIVNSVSLVRRVEASHCSERRAQDARQIVEERLEIPRLFVVVDDAVA